MSLSPEFLASPRGREARVSWYIAIKYLHVACVMLSIGGFVARFILMLKNSALLTRRWMRIAPHVNDTLLLAAAIALMVMTRQYPFVATWLTAKVFGLVAYIILGSIALKRGRTLRARIAAGLAALVAFGYVVSVALSRDARGVLAWSGV